MAKYGTCEECGLDTIVELHHIVSRKQLKSLELCKHNFAYLCYMHHRDSKKGVHFNRNLDKKYKLRLQNYLEKSFLKEELSREEIKEILNKYKNIEKSIKVDLLNLEKGYDIMSFIENI